MNGNWFQFIYKNQRQKFYNIIEQYFHMGNCVSGKKYSMLSKRTCRLKLVQISDFTFIRLLGKGSSGAVWKVMQNKSQTFYALKIMDKVKIISNKYVKTAMIERQLLTHLNNTQTDYIVKMKGSFQDENKLYLLMQLIEGDNLRQYINQGIKLSQQQIKYFIVCLIKALEYLYNNSIIHRDIKPQNIIINQQGKPYLTDFGISSFFQKQNFQFCGGSIGYMAPQLIAYNNHNFTVDYFSLGIIVYQLFFGRRPYISHTKQDFLKQLTKKPMNSNNFPQLNQISFEASDFIAKSLQKKYQKRLGNKQGIRQLKEHAWIKKFKENQQNLKMRWIKPKKGGQNMKMNKNKPYEIVYNQRQQKFYQIFHQGHLQQLFKGYDYLPTSDNSQMTTSGNLSNKNTRLTLILNS